MKPLHHRTPLWESRPLSARLGARVWLKLDALQPTGSFKIRGVGHACQSALAGGARALVASSGGNAGYAVAYAGPGMGARRRRNESPAPEQAAGSESRAKVPSPSQGEG